MPVVPANKPPVGAVPVGLNNPPGAPPPSPPKVPVAGGFPAGLGPNIEDVPAAGVVPKPSPPIAGVPPAAAGLEAPPNIPPAPVAAPPAAGLGPPNGSVVYTGFAPAAAGVGVAEAPPNSEPPPLAPNADGAGAAVEAGAPKRPPPAGFVEPDCVNRPRPPGGGAPPAGVGVPKSPVPVADAIPYQSWQKIINYTLFKTNQVSYFLYHDSWILDSYFRWLDLRGHRNLTSFLGRICSKNVV